MVVGDRTVKAERERRQKRREENGGQRQVLVLFSSFFFTTIRCRFFFVGREIKRGEEKKVWDFNCNK